VESVGGLNRNFWQGRRVFLTGHTGFKGAWLSLWLTDMGAQVTGYALPAPTEPNLFELVAPLPNFHSVIADVRNREMLAKAIQAAKPEMVIHMAAQSLVLESYRNPVETYESNVMGTVNLLEAVRLTPGIKAVVNVTTDKCYENREWDWGYRENDPLGGRDPYSNSKSCSEMITLTYRQSFFNGGGCSQSSPAVTTVRAGNVIGGGDWAPDRLMADCMRALLRQENIQMRNPQSVRPWQHVLEPLCGYLMLAEKLLVEGPAFAGAWNFGPMAEDAKTVEWIVKEICAMWGTEAGYETGASAQTEHEAYSLRLDTSKARLQLGWSPRWSIHQTLDKVVQWTKAYQTKADLRQVTLAQIHEYEQQVAR
jgi:CDP-glucose 4,6-dehydratase